MKEDVRKKEMKEDIQENERKVKEKDIHRNNLIS